LNINNHKDAFDHNGYKIQIVVSPNDCAVCHSVEHEQYKKNIMSHARGNLINNTLYLDLMKSINGKMGFQGARISITDQNKATDEEACLYCHGTEVKATRIQKKETAFGEMDFPVLEGWPNQGVGRVNPDGTKGACSACHARHAFSIQMARKPYTCAECHIGPDVPAYKVYEGSKHGNIYSTHKKDWNFDAVPWTVGKDFTAPTCAACHASLLVDNAGAIVLERSHAFADRIPWRIFGLIYAHPHPESPDLSIIVNKAGIPLPTELTGEPVKKFLIDAREQHTRKQELQKSCLTCHSSQWVENHWVRFENTLQTTNDATRAGTQIMSAIWKKGFAQGLPQKQSIFDEAVERKWSNLFLYYGNTIRFASAMAGGGDYGVFANGRYSLSGEILNLEDWLTTQTQINNQSKSKKDAHQE
jgi:hypothetical protein